MDIEHLTKEQLVATIEQMQRRLDAFPSIEQKLVSVGNKLDREVSRFQDINRYVERMLKQQTVEQVMLVASEGLIDIFDLEIGGVFKPSKDNTHLLSLAFTGCPLPETGFPLHPQWMEQHAAKGPFKARIAPLFAVSPELPFKIASTIFCPYYEKSGVLTMVFWAGISVENEDFYDPLEIDKISSFTAFCRQTVNMLKTMKDQETIRNSEARFRAIFESFQDVYYRTDMAGIIETISPSITEYSGYLPDELIGTDVSSVYTDRSPRKSMLEILARDGRVQDYNLILKSKCGKFIDASACAHFIISDDGEPIGVEGTLRDITERKRMERDLIAARDDAEAATKAKSAFLANMSHEIRTPLNGVMGMLQLLDTTRLNERQQRHVRGALISAETLLTVIGDVLDFSKIEAGQLELDKQPFSLREAVDAAIRLFADKMQAKDVELSYHIEPDVPDGLIGDSNRLRQILINLVGNSAKFTESGEIHIHCSMQESTSEVLQLQFVVRDTGPGIAPEFCNTVFKSFSQGDVSMQRRHGGTGLGLAISKQLVQLMEGEIHVTSVLGEGASFAFTVLLDRAEVDRKHPSEDNRVDGLKLLVVDDAESVRELVCAYASNWGCQCEHVSDADSALRVLSENMQTEKAYDIALLDERMPGMGGRQLAGLIRQIPDLEPVRLILLSSSNPPSATDLEQDGLSDFILKPISQSDLLSAILSTTNDSDVTSDSCRSCPHSFPELKEINEKDISILIVEDNAINQDVAQQMLEYMGYHSHIVPSGPAALAATKNQPFDLILMDCQMPGMDGYETTERIRAWEALQPEQHRTPIIALTAHAMQGDRQRCIDTGMDDYLTKPLQREKLKSTLRNWLQVFAEEEPPTLSVAPELAAEEQEVITHCCGNEALAIKLLKMHIAGIDKDLELMVTAAETQQYDLLATTAHKHKGASGNLGLNKLFNTFKKLEKAARQKAPNDEIQDLLAFIRDELLKIANFSIVEL